MAQRTDATEPGKSVGLPPRIFLYTLDQVSACIAVPVDALKRSYIYFIGRSSGTYHKNLLKARNINGPNDTPEWRIAESELIRWMRGRGFTFVYDGRLRD